jgi:hypothetical protein
MRGCCKCPTALRQTESSIQKGSAHKELAPIAQVLVSTAGGLAAALGPNVFTDLAFTGRPGGLYHPHGGGGRAASSQLLLVVSASGALFQIDYPRCGAGMP